MKEKIFLNRSLYEEAERHYSLRKHAGVSGGESLRCEVNKVRDQIKSGLDESVEVSVLLDRLNLLESENQRLTSLVSTLEDRLNKLDGGKSTPAPAPAAAKPAAAPAAAKKPADDDDIDLFGDDDEDSAEQQRIREERVKAYSEKKAKSMLKLL